MYAKVLVAVGCVALSAACAGSTDEADGSEQASAWEAQSATQEMESTHLWIVNRAVEVLAKHKDDAVAARAVALLEDPTCRTSWQQGLVDADHKAQYNDGHSDLPIAPNLAQIAIAGSTWASHFYDPDTGTNYKGKSSPTALTESKAHIGNALAMHLGDKSAKACYELGLAVHYFTDLTQPMHAANFSSLSRPALLHTNLENYALGIQDRFSLADWTGRPSGTTEAFVVETAKDSKPRFAVMVEAVTAAYKAYRGGNILKCGAIDPLPSRFLSLQLIDSKDCWAGNAGVDKVIGESLEAAQDRTAKYLYLIAAQLPAK